MMKITTATLAFTLFASLLGTSAMDAAIAMPVASAQTMGTSAEGPSSIVEARYMRHHRVRRAHRESHLGRRHCRKFSSRCTQKGPMTP